MAQSDAEFGARGPIQTCSKLHFHSMTDTYIPGDPRGILLVFYLSSCLDLRVNARRWSPLVGSHPRAQIIRPTRGGKFSPQVSNGHIHRPNSLIIVDLQRGRYDLTAKMTSAYKSIMKLYQGWRTMPKELCHPSFHFAMPGGGWPPPHFVIKALPYAFKARHGEGHPASPPCVGPKAITSSTTLYKGFQD